MLLFVGVWRSLLLFVVGCCVWWVCWCRLCGVCCASLLDVPMLVVCGLLIVFVVLCCWLLAVAVCC